MGSDGNVSVDDMRFSPSNGYSLGVEIEFQTVDRVTWDLAPFAPILIENAPSLLKPRLSPEFIQSILEIQTDVCASLVDVENDLMQTISLAEELARDNNCMLFSASLHPFARHRDQLLTTNIRYQKILEELQIVGRRFIAQGIHVHVGMPDGDTAIQVCNRIQAYLPLLLTLSTSSPYSQGEDTGLMSYRTKLFEALPLAGSYSHSYNWTGFTNEIHLLQDAGVIQSIRDLWWDARPNPVFGTVEIRICDLPFRFSDILALTATIQALVVFFTEEKWECPVLNPYIIQANKWQAARHGLNGFYVDPTGYLATGRIACREAVERMLALIKPTTVRLGTEKYMGFVQRIIEQGTGSDFLRRRYKESGSFVSVIQSLHREFWQ